MTDLQPVAVDFPELSDRLYEMQAKRQEREGQRLTTILAAKAAELGVSIDSPLIEKIAAHAETMMETEQNKFGGRFREIMAAQRIQQVFRGRSLRGKMKQQQADVDAEQRLGSDESVAAQAEELLRQMGIVSGGDRSQTTNGRPDAVPAATVVVEPTLMEKVDRTLKMMASMVFIHRRTVLPMRCTIRVDWIVSTSSGSFGIAGLVCLRSASSDLLLFKRFAMCRRSGFRCKWPRWSSRSTRFGRISQGLRLWHWPPSPSVF